jgi:dienelactone hydrolase
MRATTPGSTPRFPPRRLRWKLGKSYTIHTYDGAGHGFMFSQAVAGGANLKAAQESWPVVLQFFRKNLQ